MENCKMSKEYRRESDQELLEKLQVLAEELGHLPKRNEVPFAYELKGRFGPWPRVLEAAGLKEIGARYQRKQQKKKERKDSRRRGASPSRDAKQAVQQERAC